MALTFRAKIVGHDDEASVLVIKTPDGQYITSEITVPEHYEAMKAQGWVELNAIGDDGTELNAIYGPSKSTTIN